MSILILRPNADEACGLYPKDVAHYSLVNEASQDGDTTQVYSQWHSGGIVADYKDYYTFPAHTTESGTITKVVWNMYARSEGLYDEYYGIILVSDDLGWESDDMMSPGGPWAKHSREFTTNPGTSANWTWEDIDSIVAGIYFYPAPSNHNAIQRATQLYLEVYYTEAPKPIISTFPWVGKFQLTHVV